MVIMTLGAAAGGAAVVAVEHFGRGKKWDPATHYYAVPAAQMVVGHILTRVSRKLLGGVGYGLVGASSAQMVRGYLAANPPSAQLPAGAEARGLPYGSGVGAVVAGAMDSVRRAA